ncbi:PAQR family membrane homeostasis protein TrhA [Capillimicrobium parvum]|uniref:PAQR family membrane homeostasis protein TrhA n=1 Tax=Capillimicrobium parvum TaxID=2884022 RepID=UPI00216B4C3B|nr:hemolysin III family protein [Capillimicrobium parvum]
MSILPDVSARPSWRGRTHAWAFVAAVIGGAALVAAAPDGRARLALGIYAATVAGLFGVSAVYHRVPWRSAAARAWMRRADHAMIFLLIAGTYTPFALLVLKGPTADAILIAIWAGAAAGIVLKLIWIHAPKWLGASAYVALGWIALAAVPELVEHAGVTATAVLGVGGLLYTIGAVVYAVRRPDPIPSVFGYHEVFHALVIAAAALQFAVVAALTL